MFNFSYSHIGQTQWEFNKSTNSFIIKSLTKIDNNAEIYLNYGLKIQYKYLYTYGFTIFPYEHNGIYLQFNFNISDPLLKTKEFLIDCKNTPYICDMIFYENFDIHFVENMQIFSLLRFINYEGSIENIGNFVDPPVKNFALAKNEKRKICIYNGISRKNELKCLQKLKEIAMKILQNLNMKNTISTDIKLYNENIQIYYEGEKHVLMEIIKFCEICIQILSNKSLKKAQNYFDSVKKNIPNFTKYINEIIFPLFN